ncbi:hypothetical protein [Phenylobacterium sp. SCN 70-31]|uniref:hypothetical protein n=1 Tax=Phenylobacterium sp. SCN 70-31 TaxID=1660129 RepID=UPI00086A89EB|nr:hypothetical protein [Phenylobacterium sp. SCN 70-31]ODT86515.1 MAG: hypothetical protein ABS78_16335 [Phenylobacterium sp. SCN 70-31]
MTAMLETGASDAPRRELVQWMEPGPMRLERSGLAAVALAGAVVGLAGIAAACWIAPRREGLPPWRWGRGALH